MKIGLRIIAKCAIVIFPKKALIQFKEWRQILDAIKGIYYNMIEPSLCIAEEIL